MAGMSKASNEQQWAERVAAWRASGLTSTAYSAGREVSAGGLRHWAYLLKKRGAKAAVGTAPAAPAVRLVRVKAAVALAPRTAAPSAGAPLMIELAGARIAVPAGVDAPTLRTVIELLAGTNGGRR